MNLAELCSEVYTLTNRPDLVADTKLAVKAATLKAHQSDFYYKDLFETGVQFASADYTQSLDYRALFPRYRSLKYIRKCDATGTPGDFIDIITPAAVLDKYNTPRENVCYAAGEVINIKSSTQLQYILFGCYLNPDVTEAGYSSWVALDHPYFIVFEAASQIYKSIGQDETANKYEKMAAEQLAMIKSSNLYAEGY